HCDPFGADRGDLMRLVPFGLDAESIVAVVDPAIADAIRRRFRNWVGIPPHRPPGAPRERAERAAAKPRRHESRKVFHGAPWRDAMRMLAASRGPPIVARSFDGLRTHAHSRSLHQ